MQSTNKLVGMGMTERISMASRGGRVHSTSGYCAGDLQFESQHPASAKSSRKHD